MKGPSKFLCRLNIYPEHVNWYLNSAFELRQILCNLLERKAAYPILIEGGQMFLKSTRRCNVIPTSIWFKAEYEET
jgi:hypothetical protein